LEASGGLVGVQELKQNPKWCFSTCGHGNTHRPSFGNLSLRLDIYDDYNPSDYYPSL
jgi:hypothetical protein